MNSFFTQVSSSIRILGWNRDASARATHLKAAGGNVPSATIERKSMSTKTSIKRIALVAAAALALGGFSAVSASAADNTYMFPQSGDGASFSTVTGAGTTLNGVAGPANFVTLGFTDSLAGIATITGGTFGAVSGSNITLNTAATQVTAASNVTLGAVTVLTPTVGTITVNYYKNLGVGSYASTPTESVVITVNAAASSGVFSLAKSTIFMASGETKTAATADATVSASSKINLETAVATIQVNLKDSLGAAYKDSVTATITSGPGTIFGSQDSTTTDLAANTNAFYSNPSAPLYSTTVSGLSNTGEILGQYFGIFANGQTGTTVVSFKNSAGTVLGTKSITFTGTTPLAMTVTVKKSYVLNSGVTKKAIAVTLQDAATGGNNISGASTPLTITGAVATGSTIGAAIASGDCAWNTTDSVYYCAVTSAGGTTAGKETYKLTSGTATGTAVINFVSGVAKTITIAGPASADPGSKATFSLTATDSAGSPLPDGVYSPGALLTAANPTSNSSLTVQPFGATETITLTAGVATSYTYAPYGGTLSLSWVAAGSSTATADRAATSAVDGSSTIISIAGIAKGLGAAVIAADDIAITSNTEATAAANAATDAANQAADAADNATQAAAEALAAVNTLATTVATLIDGIKNQIKALNTLILAIKKKIKA